MNVLMMGCAIGWLPNAIYFLMHGDEVHATFSQCDLIASLSQLGKLVFAIPGGLVVDKYGRKKVIIGVAFLNFFSWLGLSSSTSLIAIYVGQFALGAGQALTQEAYSIAIGETASPAIRGQLSSVSQIFLTIGVILPAVISVIFSSYKILAWIVTLLSFLSLLSMVMVSETPNFLISTSKFDQAREKLEILRRGCPVDEIDSEFEDLKKYIENENARRDQLNWLTFLKLKSTRGPILTAILIKFFTTGTGRSLITTYVTTIYPANEFVPKKYYPLIMQIIILLINVFTAFYIEKFPRRAIIIFGAIAITYSNSFSALVNYIHSKNQSEIFNGLFLLGNVLYLIFFNGMVQPINSTIKTELFPQAVKGFGGSVTIVSQAVSTLISYQTYYFITKYFYLYDMYVVLAINSLVLAAIVYFLLPESRGSTLVDVQMNFQPNREPCNNGSKEVRTRET
ncbi:uncharacterized protein LOC135843866 isoform X2 [Planococcus citri]